MTPEIQEQNQEQAQLQTRNDSQAKNDKARDKAFIQSHYQSNILYNLEAIRLWQQGRKSWNKWVKQNPECDVDFSKVDFGVFVKRGEVEGINFSFFTFPKGKVDFSQAQFGDGEVSFWQTKFGDGDVSFREAQFGDGLLIFYQAIFGEGKIDFYCAQFSGEQISFEETRFGGGETNFSSTYFGDSDVNFSKAHFGDGSISFEKARFGDGNVNFAEAKFCDGELCFDFAKFGVGTLSFRHALFGNGDVSFNHAQFGDGTVNFFNAQFGDGKVSFENARFGVGDVSFAGANFGEGTTDFRRVDFGSGNTDFSTTRFGKGTANFSATRFGTESVDFQLIECHGNLLLRNLHDSNAITSLSLSGASIDGLLSLSNNTFTRVPDLTETNIKHDIELQTLQATLRRKRLSWKGLWAKKAINYSDIERLRKLKQIAESNKHHDAALRFHADEMRARRWQTKERGGFSFFGSVLDLLYSAVCNYGQSILQPVIGLILSWGVFFAIYFNLTKNELTDGHSLDLLVFTATNSIPFIPVAKTVREIAYKELFDTGLLLFTTMSAQAVVSFVFIFLISLGVRNRFRI